MINLLFTLNIMFCDIKGAVKNPGVYQVNNNNIYEVINMAGGLKKDAILSYINLSKKVTDEMVIYIPSINDKPKKCQCNCPKQECLTTTLPTTTTVTTTTSMATNLTTTIPHTTITKLVNINIASKEELMTLNGVGEKIADKILEYRNQHPFQSIDELLNIEGIGEKTFAKIQDFIKV